MKSLFVNTEADNAGVYMGCGTEEQMACVGGRFVDGGVCHAYALEVCCWDGEGFVCHMDEPNEDLDRMALVLAQCLARAEGRSDAAVEFATAVLHTEHRPTEVISEILKFLVLIP